MLKLEKKDGANLRRIVVRDDRRVVLANQHRIVLSLNSVYVGPMGKGTAAENALVKEAFLKVADGASLASVASVIGRGWEVVA